MFCGFYINVIHLKHLLDIRYNPQLPVFTPFEAPTFSTLFLEKKRIKAKYHIKSEKERAK